MVNLNFTQYENVIKSQDDNAITRVKYLLRKYSSYHLSNTMSLSE